MLGLQQVDLRLLGVLVGDLGDILVPPECLCRQRFHQVYELKVERELDFAIIRLRVGQLVNVSHGTHASVWHGLVEAHPFVVQVIQEIQALAIKVPQSLIPKAGASRSQHCQLRPVAHIVEIRRERVDIVLQLLKGKYEVFLCPNVKCSGLK